MKYINKFSLFGLLLLTIFSFSAKAQTIQLGSGTGTSSFIPNYYLYNYSYSQTIYTAAELIAGGAAGIPGTVTKIRYKPTASVSTANWKNWTIYMGNTTQVGFTGSYNWTSSSAMTSVFSGDLPLATTVANTWMEITLTTPFAWDGTSNIVIGIDENTPTWGSSPNWAGYTLAPATGTKGIYFYSDGTNPDPTAPPTSGSSSGATNVVAQIQLDGNFAPACTGTPTAGTVPATAGICAGAPYTLVATGATTGASGLVGQWQSRTPVGTGPWTNLTGATSATYTVAAMPSVPTDYRYTLTCGTNTGNSNVLTTTINAPSTCYCIPTAGASSTSYYLNNITTTGGITNLAYTASSYASYVNNSATTFSQAPGGNINISLASSGGSTYYFYAWIDWNADGDFDDPGETVIASTGYVSSFSGPITVPATQAAGNFRVRFAANYLGTTAPCGPNNYGNFVDFTLNVPVCAGTPASAVIPASVSVCPTNSAPIVATSVASAGGISFQWQSSPTAGGTYTDVTVGTGATTTSYTPVATLSSGTYYFKLKTICAGSGLSSLSNVNTYVVTIPPTAPTATNSSQCGLQVPTASVASTAGANGTGTFKWYDAPNAGNLLQGQAFATTATTWYSDTYSGTVPTATATLGGSAAISGGKLVLQPAVTGGDGNIVINASGSNASLFNTDFDATVTATGSATADGFSYSFGDDVVGLGNTTTPTAEKGSGSKLRLLFMTYNTAVTNGKGIYLVYNTNATDFTPTANGVLAFSNNATWIPTAAGSLTTHISLSIDATGKANVMLGATPLFTNVQLPAAYLAENKATWKHAISSRSGGVAGGFAIDNIVLQKNAPIPGYTTYQQPVAVTTTFYVSETSPGGCESPRTPITVTVNTPPTISVAVPAAVCLGQSVTAVASSSNANYVYSWTPGSLTGASQSLSPSTTTTYVVTANDPTTGNPTSGCATNATFTLNVNPAPTNVLVTASLDTITCGNISMLTATGGTSPNITILSENFNAATNNWTTINNSVGGTPALAAWTLMPNGSNVSFYTLNSNDNSQFYATNSDAQGSGGTTATILQSPAFSTVNYTSAAVTLYQYYYALGDSANVEASLDGTTWTILKSTKSSSGSASIFAFDSIPLTPAFLNQPTVYVRFKYGSSWGYFWALDNVKIKGDKKEPRVWTPTTGLFTNAAGTIPYTGASTDTVYAKPVVNQTYTATATNTQGCINPNVNNTKTITVKKLVNLGNDTTVCSGTPVVLNAGTLGTTYAWSTGATTQTITVSLPGTYSVGVTNGTCTTYDTMVLSNTPTPIVNLGNDTSICAGSTLTLNAGAANASYTKLWSNAATTQTIAVTTAGTYSVTVTNGLCVKKDTIVVGITPLPIVNLGNDTAICGGSTLTLSAGAANSSFTKLWSTAATTQTINVTNPGTYILTVSNGACSKKDTIVVTQAPTPTVNLGNDTIICAGTSLTLDAGAANSTFTKLWSTTATTQTISVNTSGTYSVKVTNGLCSKYDTIVVNVVTTPTVNLGNDTAICSGSSKILSAGSANTALAKLWSTGQTTQNITVTTAGTYSVKVGTGTCAKSDTIVITVTPSPVVNLGNDTAICSGTSLTLSAGTANSSFTKLWSTGASTQTINVTTAGSYKVTVTDGLCSKKDTINVSVTPTPVVNIGNDTAICTGSSITLNAGNPNYSRIWSTGAATQTIVVNAAGTYSVLVNNGLCYKSDTIVITENPLPASVNIGADTSFCQGKSVTLDAGNPGMSYLWSTGATTQTIVVNASGTYSVAVINGFNCSKSDTINVVVDPLPAITSIYVTGNSPSYFFSTVNPINVTTFNWNFGDGSTGTGATPLHTYATTNVEQTFVVTLIVSNNCGTDTFKYTVVVKAASAIGDLELSANSLKLFPNPTAETVTLENESSYKMTNVSIINILGQEVLNEKINNSSKHRMNVSNLAPGLYNVKIEFKEGTVTRKLEIIR